jgi:uncharacterized membrane protein YphA (DoxX/SURF4 family)
VVVAIGIVAIARRREWQKLHGLELLILLGPIFYAAPLSAFGTEHFTITAIIASIVPRFVPWHMFWAYFVGACFIAAGLSISSGIFARVSSPLVGVTFFCFVCMMGVPGFARQPHNWVASVLMVRELAFSGGALALAATLLADSHEPESRILATIARYFVAVPVTYYAIQQFLHPDHVPGIPLEKLTPGYVPAHTIWPYLTAAVYVVGGVLLLVGKRTRMAALAVGAALLAVELIVYVPIAVVQRADLEGFNYMADTLMFCGAVLLLAGAMKRETA